MKRIENQQMMKYSLVKGSPYECIFQYEQDVQTGGADGRARRRPASAKSPGEVMLPMSMYYSTFSLLMFCLLYSVDFSSSMVGLVAFL